MKSRSSTACLERISVRRPGWPPSSSRKAASKDVALRLTPGVAGILQVFVDGDKIYDKKEEDGQFPNLPRVKQMRAVIRDKLSALVAADD